MPNFRQFRDIEVGEQFHVFADTAVGGLDRCAVQFLSATKLDIPLVYHAPVIATIMTNELLPVLNTLSAVTGFKPYVCYERNNGGAFEMDRLASLNKQGLFEIYQQQTVGFGDVTSGKKLGWDTNTATRPQMLGGLKECIDQGLITIYDPETIKELYSFVVVKTSSSWKATAESGAHDDLVMSLSGAWQLYLSGYKFNSVVSEPKRFQGYSGGNQLGFGRRSVSR